MVVSSTANSSFSRSVTPSQSSHDRRANEENQATILENKSQERALERRAVHENMQRRNEETQRRLDGRLISFGYENNDKQASEQKQTSYNRSRVNEAYTPPPRHEVSHSPANQHSSNDSDAIDIVV